MERPWFRAAMAAETADALLHAHVRGTGAVLRRVSAIIDMVATATAPDAGVAQQRPDGEQPRLRAVHG